MESPNGQHWVKTQPQSNGNADNCSTYNVAGVPKYTPRATAALPEPIPSINFPFSSAAVYAKPGDSPKLNNLMCCLDDSELFHLLFDVDIMQYYPHITATRCVKIDCRLLPNTRPCCLPETGSSSQAAGAQVYSRLSGVPWTHWT